MIGNKKLLLRRRAANNYKCILRTYTSSPAFTSYPTSLCLIHGWLQNGQCRGLVLGAYFSLGAYPLENAPETGSQLSM